MILLLAAATLPGGLDGSMGTSSSKALHSPRTPTDSPRAPARARRLVTLPRSTQLAFREAGVDLDALARRVGAAAAAARFTPAQADALLDLAFAAVGDPAHGLTIGSNVRPELFGMIGLAAMAAPTYGAALARFERYKRVFSADSFELVGGRDATTVRVHLARPEGPHARARADMELAFIVSFGRTVTRTHVVPLRVDVRGPAPAYRDRYHALFGCSVWFDQPNPGVVLGALDLARPLVSSSSELESLVGPRADALLVESGGEDIVARVGAVLRRMLNGDEPSMEAVARALGTSARSLQRRLGEAGASFAALLDEARHEIARERLAHTDLGLAALSFMLGFSTPSSLHRAFKRWEGMTPLEYRRAARARR